MCHKTLPEGYTFLDKIDLQKNKKQFWLVQGIGLLIMTIMLVGGYFIERVNFFDEDYITSIIAIAVLVVSYVLYIILHEATHGLVMYLSVRAKLNFGFVGWGAYAGSTGYFDKKHYILISLAPLVVWGIVFAVLNVFFHSGVWFWVIWLLQAGNISGACGDLFCTFKMFTYPKDVLVHDTGTNMTVFRKMTEEELAAERQITENTQSDTVINGDNSID